MGFLPSRMSRLLIGGHKAHLEGVIDALHAEGVVHIEDFRDPMGVTGIGTPLEAGEGVSATLVRIRGLLKAMGAEAVAPDPGAAVGSPSSILESAETDAGPTLDRLRQAREEMARVEAEEGALLPLRGLDLDVGTAATLRTVRTFVGLTRVNPTAALQRANANHEAQVVPSGSAYAVAVVAVAKDASLVERALSECGFTPTPVPPGQAGTPAQRLAALAQRKAAVRADLASAEAATASLRAQWGPRLAAAEARLVVEVEKTQAPLRFGVTQTTFHIEGWVPKARVAAVSSALQARFAGALYFEELGDAPAADGHGAHAVAPGGGPGHGMGGGGAPAAHAAEPGAHGAQASGHGAGHGDAHGAHGEHGDDHHESDPAHEPPIHLDNPRPARPYEWILGLLARPRYNEVDPSKLMLFFFPLFFGLMVGDVLVGLLILLLGLWLRNNRLIGIGGPAVGKAIAAGGLVSIVVGLFVFGEALGIHFVTEDPSEMSWETILGLHIPFQDQPHGLIYKTGSSVAHAAGAASDSLSAAVAGAAGGAVALAPLAAGEEAAHGILSPHSSVHLSVGGLVNLGYYSKLHDVQPLLIWSLIIGVVHIVLGLLLGVRNVYVAHGAPLAIQEKAAWLGLMAGGAVAYAGSTMADAAGITQSGWIVLGGGLGLAVASLVLLWMGAAKVMGMGFIALLEIPSLFGNIVSYTRLAAIGASKAGLGLAIGVISFDILGGGVVGWLFYSIGFLGITLLAVLTGSLQSLRLQFVEFFGKFFTGGGRPYVPFGRRAA